MAEFTRTHGNAQQVFHIDTNNGALSGALAESAPVNLQGPKLDFFKIIVENGANSAQDLQAEVGTGYFEQPFTITRSSRNCSTSSVAKAS